MVCPKKVLAISAQLNNSGYFPAYQGRPELCVLCAVCCTMCPDAAITITEIADPCQCAAENDRAK